MNTVLNLITFRMFEFMILMLRNNMLMDLLKIITPEMTQDLYCYLYVSLPDFKEKSPTKLDAKFAMECASSMRHLLSMQRNANERSCYGWENMSKVKAHGEALAKFLNANTEHNLYIGYKRKMVTLYDYTHIEEFQTTNFLHAMYLMELDPGIEFVNVSRYTAMPGMIVSEVIYPDMQQFIIKALRQQGFFYEEYFYSENEGTHVRSGRYSLYPHKTTDTHIWQQWDNKGRTDNILLDKHLVPFKNTYRRIDELSVFNTAKRNDDALEEWLSELDPITGDPRYCNVTEEDIIQFSRRYCR